MRSLFTFGRLLVGISCSTLSYTHANTEHSTDVSFDYSKPISSLNILQSLHDVPKHLDFKVPHVQEMFSPEKVRTLFVESHQLPIVDLQLTFDAGSARDESIDKGLFGLAHLTARLLNEGTATQSADDIATVFENMGAQYSAHAYRDMFIVKLRVKSDPKYFEPALKQLILLLKGANFPQSSIERLRNNAQVGQQQVLENPTRSMSVRFYRMLYQGHPYAEPSTGTSQSLKKIDSSHIQAFRNKYLVRNNVNIAITGDINSTQAYEISKLISVNLPEGEKAPSLADVKPLSEEKIILNTFDSSQAYIMIGQLGIKRNNPDRFAIEVGNEILGGSGFNSLLMKELREKRGYTYGASSQITSMLAQGMFSMSYSTRREQLLPSISVAYQTLLNFMYQPLDAQMVEDTKIAILRKFPQLLSSNANINAQLGALGFYNMPANYLAEYPTYISSITADNIQQAWQKYLQPDKLLTIIVGKDLNRKDIENIYQLQRQQLMIQPKVDKLEQDVTLISTQ